MKIVDETHKNLNVKFDSLCVGDAFAVGDECVWRKSGGETAIPVYGDVHFSDAYFNRDTLVTPVDYDITVKSRAKKKVQFKNLPMFGVFKFDAIVWVKTHERTAWRLDRPEDPLPVASPDLMVEPVDATVTISSVE